MMADYRVILTPDDNGTFLVTCPQSPMVATFGATEAEALLNAEDAISTVIASMIDDGEEIPLPAARRPRRRPAGPATLAGRAQAAALLGARKSADQPR